VTWAALLALASLVVVGMEIFKYVRSRVTHDEPGRYGKSA
jgi:hypothetical protein